MSFNCNHTFLWWIWILRPSCNVNITGETDLDHSLQGNTAILGSWWVTTLQGFRDAHPSSLSSVASRTHPALVVYRSSRWKAPWGQPAVTPRHVGVSGELMSLNGFSRVLLSTVHESHSVSEWGQRESLGIIILIHAQLWFRLNGIPIWG